jgi:hypothetical protein
VTAERYWEGMTMKKALLLVTIAAVIIFNSVGFFAIGQDSPPEKENLSVVHVSTEVDNSSFDAGSASGDGMEANNPISVTHFTILVSSLILILLIGSQASRN